MIGEKIEVLTNRHIARRYKSNISRDERQALISIKEKITDKTIRICMSDRGDDFVAIERSVEFAMMGEILSGDSVYKRKDEDDTESKRKQLNRGLREVIAVRNLRGMNGLTHGPLRIPRTASYVRNVEGLLETLQSRRGDVMGSCVMSFDFESLYTNVDNEGGIRALKRSLGDCGEDIKPIGMQ
ncbi:hypothetical protein ACOME3_008171 [Neoechinorhynchus agilis]